MTAALGDEAMKQIVEKQVAMRETFHLKGDLIWEVSAYEGHFGDTIANLGKVPEHHKLPDGMVLVGVRTQDDLPRPLPDGVIPISKAYEKAAHGKISYHLNHLWLMMLTAQQCFCLVFYYFEHSFSIGFWEFTKCNATTSACEVCCCWCVVCCRPGCALEDDR